MTPSMSTEITEVLQDLKALRPTMNPTYLVGVVRRAISLIGKLRDHVSSLEQSESDLVARMQTMVPKPSRPR